MKNILLPLTLSLCYIGILTSCAQDLDPLRDVPKLEIAEKFQLPFKNSGAFYVGNDILLTNTSEDETGYAGINNFAIDLKQKKIVKSFSWSIGPVYYHTYPYKDRFVVKTQEGNYINKFRIFDSSTLENTNSIDISDRYALHENAFIQEGQDFYVKTYHSLTKYNIDDFFYNSETKPEWVFKDFGHKALYSLSGAELDSKYVYVAGEDTELDPNGLQSAIFAIDKKTGKTIWKKNDIFIEGEEFNNRYFDINIITDPKEEDVYVTENYTNKLYRLKADTGAVVWGPVPYTFQGCTFDAGVPVSKINMSSNTVIVTMGLDSCVTGIDKNTGAHKWTFNSPNNATFFIEPLVLNDVLYHMNGKVLAIDTNTGKLLAASPPLPVENYTNKLLNYDPIRNVIWRSTNQQDFYAYKPVQLP